MTSGGDGTGATDGVTDIDIILHALRLKKERRLRIAVEGHTVNVVGDDAQPTALKQVSESGGGQYLTDGKTFEAIVGYDIKNDLRRMVVYRLPAK
jgi:4-hydroxy-3-methylbut-2-en-1-yl diphosphate synthase IspG/GcpE